METSVRQKRIELRQAIIDLRERGLLSQAQWAAEQLVGLPDDEHGQDPGIPTMPSAAHLTDRYLLARTHFDLKVCRGCFAAWSRQGYVLHEAPNTHAGVPTVCTCVARCYQSTACVSTLLCYLLARRKAKRVCLGDERATHATANKLVHLLLHPIHTHRETRLEQARAPGATTAPPGSAAAAPVAPEGVARGPPARNPELESLERELCEVLNNGTGDAFTTFLYGIVLIDRYGLSNPATHVHV